MWSAGVVSAKMHTRTPLTHVHANTCIYTCRWKDSSFEVHLYAPIYPSTHLPTPGFRWMLQSEHVRRPRNVSRAWHFSGMLRWVWCDRLLDNNFWVVRVAALKILRSFAFEEFLQHERRMHCTGHECDGHTLCSLLNVTSYSNRFMSSSQLTSRFVEWPFLDVFGWGGVWCPVQDRPGLLCAALAWVEACCNNIVLSININYSWYITHNFPCKLACDCSEENGGWHFAILKSIKDLTFGVVSWGPWLDWIYETATCYVKLCWGLWKRSTLRPLHRTKYQHTNGHVQCKKGHTGPISRVMNGYKWVIMGHKSHNLSTRLGARCCSSHWSYSSQHCARTCAARHGPLQHSGFAVAHFWRGSPGALALGSLVVEGWWNGWSLTLEFLLCSWYNIMQSNLCRSGKDAKGLLVLKICLQSGMREKQTR